VPRVASSWREEGFPAGQELRERYFPKPVAQYTSAFEGCVGETLLLAQGIGRLARPVGRGQTRSGSQLDLDAQEWVHDGVPAPIVLDRAKPGLVRRQCGGAAVS